MAVLDDLVPGSGLALRRWTPDEYRHMSFPAVFGSEERLDLANGEVVQRGTGVPRLFGRRDYYRLAELEILAPDERTELICGMIIKGAGHVGRPHSIAVDKTAAALRTALSGGCAALRLEYPGARGRSAAALAARKTPVSLDELLQQVNSKDTFLRFAHALAADFEDERQKEEVHPTPWLGVVPRANGWYSFTIDAFLDQMCIWAAATSATTDEPMVPEQPSWRTFAGMLSTGREYE